MVTDLQVKRVWRLAQKLSVEAAAAKAGMDSKTAWKYLRDRRLPSEMRQTHTWRTRLDPFADTWEEIRQLLSAEPAGRQDCYLEELSKLQPLPEHRLDSMRRERVRVRPGSLVTVHRNYYSVHSRLIGEMVEACPTRSRSGTPIAK